MTSTSAPFGLRSSRRIGGNANAMGQNRYRIANGFATAIFTGDPVALNTAGNIVPVTAAASIAIGVFAGCQYVDSTWKQPRWSSYFPAATSSYGEGYVTAFVIDDPDRTFAVQANASVSAGDVGYYFNVTTGSGGSTLFGTSSYGLDAGSRTNLAPKTLQVIDFVDQPDNAFSDAYPIVEVRIAEHKYSFTSAS